MDKKELDANPALVNQAREDGLGPAGFGRGESALHNYAQRKRALCEDLEALGRAYEDHRAALASKVRGEA